MMATVENIAFIPIYTLSKGKIGAADIMLFGSVLLHSMIKEFDSTDALMTLR